jgi:hypothetical protein
MCKPYTPCSKCGKDKEICCDGKRGGRYCASCCSCQCHEELKDGKEGARTEEEVSGVLPEALRGGQPGTSWALSRERTLELNERRGGA